MKHFRNILLILGFGAILLMPLPMELLSRHADIGLSGVTDEAAPPSMDTEALMDGSLQSGLDSYVSSELPGRDLMIKLRNQALFSVFDISPNSNIIIGKDHDLFEEEYISKYEKVYPPAEESYVRELCDDLTYISDKLEEQGKELYIFITPTKVRYYEEDVPDTFRAGAAFTDMPGNHEIFTKVLSEYDLKVYDSIAYIDTIKEGFDYPLYYRTGTHWSWPLATAVTIDLTAWLDEQSSYSFTPGTMECREVSAPVYPDADIFDSLNLFEESYDRPYYEAVFSAAPQEGERPSLFCRGGSFMGQSLTTLINSGYFDSFTYVENTNAFRNDLTAPVTFSDYSELDLAAALEEADVVILEVNEAHIPTMSFGLIEYIMEHPEVL